MFHAWQSITLWKRVLIGLVIGLAIGLVLRYTLPPAELKEKVAVDVQAMRDAQQDTYKTDLERLGYTPLATLVGSPSASHGTVQVVDEERVVVPTSLKSEGQDSADQNEGPEDAAVVETVTTLVYTPESGFTGKDEIVLVASEPFGNATYAGNTFFLPFGELFVRLIKMLIIPLIATTLVTGVTAMGDPKKLGSLGIKTIGLYLVTTFFAVSLGLAIGTIVRPGVGINVGAASQSSVESVKGKIQKAEDSGSVVDRLLKIVPENPVSAMASNDVLATIFFSLMIGIGILLAGKTGEPVRVFFDAASEVVMKVTIMIMELAPYGVLALMSWVMATRGIEILGNLMWLTLALYLACVLQIVLVYGGLIIGVFLRLPPMQFFKGILDAQGVAFSTASSSATLPMTISCAETNLGVEKSVAGSVLPLGATINMDGTAIYLGLIALFAAQALNIPMTPNHYVIVALTATLVSIGAAGIPSAGLLLAATVLGVIGVEEGQAVLIIAFIFPFDRLLDMMRTVTNVTGDIAVACAVAKMEGQLDEVVFRTEAEI